MPNLMTFSANDGVTVLAEKIYQMKAGSVATRSDRILLRVDPVTALRSVPGFHRFPAFIDLED